MPPPASREVASLLHLLRCLPPSLAPAVLDVDGMLALVGGAMSAAAAVREVDCWERAVGQVPAVVILARLDIAAGASELGGVRVVPLAQIVPVTVLEVGKRLPAECALDLGRRVPSLRSLSRWPRRWKVLYWAGYCQPYRSLGERGRYTNCVWPDGWSRAGGYGRQTRSGYDVVSYVSRNGPDAL